MLSFVFGSQCKQVLSKLTWRWSNVCLGNLLEIKHKKIQYQYKIESLMAVTSSLNNISENVFQKRPKASAIISVTI